MGRHVPILPVDPPLSTQETAKLALAFCGLWFAANWAMNAALGYTSVSSTTILTSMSGKFCFSVILSFRSKNVDDAGHLRLI